jgi:hypothetical protein
VARTHGLLVEQAVDRPAQGAEAGLEDQHPALVREHPPELLEGCARVAQVVEHVEQDQGGHATVLEGEAVGVLHAVYPGVGEEVGAYAPLDNLPDVCHA